MTMCDANQNCDELVAILRDSGLNFLIQETPFSLFITIRKTLYKEPKKNFSLTENLYQLQTENSALENALEEEKLQHKMCRDKSVALQSRLEKAEKELLLHSKNAKISDEKSREEISMLKAVLKKNEDVISSLKSKSSEAAKSKKFQEQNIHDLRNKNESLIEQVTNLKASKNELKKEKNNLALEVKALKTRMQKISKSESTETSSTPSSGSCLNVLLNNNNPATSVVTTMSVSMSTQTCLQFSDSVPAVSTSSSRSSKSIQCLVCSENFYSADELIEHAGSEHDLSIDAETLSDSNENDDFVKFLRSMNIDDEYLKDREKYYPEKSDHLHERIKIRIIAQMKFSSHSLAIERNMKENDLKHANYIGINRET